MNKYNARKVVIDNIKFDSQREGDRYLELKLLLRAGVISSLKDHPKYLIFNEFKYRGNNIRPIYYIADFEYQENGETVVEDVKGVKTKVFMLKAKLFKYRYPDIDFRVVK